MCLWVCRSLGWRVLDFGLWLSGLGLRVWGLRRGVPLKAVYKLHVLHVYITTVKESFKGDH